MARHGRSEKRSVLQKALVGPAAEHFVLYKLHSLGFLATMAPQNAPTVDILVMNPDESIAALVQVKARTRGRDKGWHMRQKHEGQRGERLYYALVDLEEAPPVTYVVPAQIIADVLAKSHAAWLAQPGIRGPHRDHPMRRVLPRYPFDVDGYPDKWLARYRESWELLGGPVPRKGSDELIAVEIEGDQAIEEALDP